MAAETIYALASGRPPAAVAIIRVSGIAAHRVAVMLGGALPPARSARLRSLHDPQSGELLDEVLVLRFDGPASATGEDVVELHCHGSRAVVDAILDALGGLDGFRLAEPGEFTRRAFENGRIDLTEAEGLADLLEAETEWQRRAALALAEGALRRQIEHWRERLLGLSAYAEAAIDYVDEDDTQSFDQYHRGCEALALELSSWAERPVVEPLKQGLRVVLAGPPNSGKSSLLNALIGAERAIVTDLPGTTRDYLEVPISVAGIPLILTDTAGLRAGGDLVETIGISRAEQQVERADILLWLGDPADAPRHRCRVLLLAKADLCDGLARRSDQLPVSSVTGEGLPALMEEIVARARQLLPEPDAVALNRRQAKEIGMAASALIQAATETDIVLVAEHLRSARAAFERLTGRSGVEDVLDALFGRFCLGK